MLMPFLSMSVFRRKNLKNSISGNIKASISSEPVKNASEGARVSNNVMTSIPKGNKPTNQKMAGENFCVSVNVIAKR